MQTKQASTRKGKNKTPATSAAKRLTKRARLLERKAYALWRESERCLYKAEAIRQAACKSGTHGADLNAPR